MRKQEEQGKKTKKEDRRRKLRATDWRAWQCKAVCASPAGPTVSSVGPAPLSCGRTVFVSATRLAQPGARDPPTCPAGSAAASASKRNNGQVRDTLFQVEKQHHFVGRFPGFTHSVF